MDNSTLTKKQIMLSRIAIGILSLLAGVFLLLIGLDIIGNIAFFRAAVAISVAALGLMLLTVGFIQNNTLFIWLSIIFVVTGFIVWFALCDCSLITFRNAYPVFVFAPALASAVSAVYDGGWKTHLKVIVPLTIAAGVLALNSMFGLQWGIVIPVFIFLFGLSWLLFAITPHIRWSNHNKHKTKEEEE